MNKALREELKRRLKEYAQSFDNTYPNEAPATETLEAYYGSFSYYASFDLRKAISFHRFSVLFKMRLADYREKKRK